MPRRAAAVKKEKPLAAKVSAVQLWYGENQSLLSLEVARWRDEFAKRHPQAVITRLEYKPSEATEFSGKLHQAAYGGGLFVDKRLVIVYNVLKAEAKGEVAELVKQLTHEAPEGLFLLLVETDKVAWSKPLAAAIKKSEQVTLREFSNLPPAELERWIVARAKAEGGNVSPAVARLLAALTGNDFLKLTQEIAKLTAYRGAAEVRAADLDLLVTSTLQDDVFVFVEAVGRRDMKAASAALTRQFDQGTSAQQLVGLLAWHLRVLTGVRLALDDATGKPTARELAETLGLHPFVVTKALQQIPYYSADRLAWLYGELSNLDVALKTSQTDPQVLFGLFLSKLATLSVVR